MNVESSSEGGWPGGWVIAAAAGVVAAILMRWMGDNPMPGAVLVGLSVFVVFGVLLGMFWAVPAAAGSHEDHGRGDHGYGHAPVPVVHAPVVAPAPIIQAAPALQPVPSEIPVPGATAEPVQAAAAVAARAPVDAFGAPVALVADTPAAETVATRPVGLVAARGGKGDDLEVLEGIGPAMAKLCHELGFFHFDQIAAWGPTEVAWMDGNLKGFKGRVTRDKWVVQARMIGELGVEEFKRRANTNDY